MARTTTKGTSLAKGPAAIVGLILLAYGVTALLFGSHSFTTHAVSGQVSGKSWLGLEVNGWSSLLTAGAGLLVLLAAPLHWGAKSIALIAGLILGAASVILLSDGSDVFGIFAGNGKTALAWGIAAAVLLIVGLLPRVGGKDLHDDRDRGRRVAEPEPVAVQRPRPKAKVVETEPVEVERPRPTARVVETERVDVQRPRPTARVVDTEPVDPGRSSRDEGVVERDISSDDGESGSRRLDSRRLDT